MEHGFRADVTVGIPWRPGKGRIRPYRRVREWWDYAGFRVITGDSDRNTPFNRAQARNRLVEKIPTDLCILADADTIPDLGGLLAALANPQGVTWPFNRYRLIGADYVDRSDLLGAPAILDIPNSSGGLWVFRKHLYWSLGGCDERFTTWGWEDSAFWATAQTLAYANRTAGTVHSFDHPAARDVEENREMADPYLRANGRPWLMREVLKQRNTEDDQAADKET